MITEPNRNSYAEKRKELEPDRTLVVVELEPNPNLLSCQGTALCWEQSF